MMHFFAHYFLLLAGLSGCLADFLSLLISFNSSMGFSDYELIHSWTRVIGVTGRFHQVESEIRCINLQNGKQILAHLFGVQVRHYFLQPQNYLSRRGVHLQDWLNIVEIGGLLQIIPVDLRQVQELKKYDICNFFGGVPAWNQPAPEPGYLGGQLTEQRVVFL